MRDATEGGRSQPTMPGRVKLPGQWSDQTPVADEDAIIVAKHQGTHTRVAMRARDDGDYERIITDSGSDDPTTDVFEADCDIHALWETIEWLRGRERNSLNSRGGF